MEKDHFKIRTDDEQQKGQLAFMYEKEIVLS